MMETLEQRATVQDYERLEEGAPYQLIGGELIMTPSPTPFHQSIVLNIGSVLSPFVVRNRLGKVFVSPIAVYLSEEDVYQPDLIFIRADRVQGIRKDKLRVMPDLVIEVLSPSTAYYDLTRKQEIYCSSGVAEYWVIDPEAETIEILVKRGDLYQTEHLLHKTETLRSAMFPGFSLNVEDVFEF